ncbi:MAG: redoxin family protein [Planctomycetaceae bacterium]|nr:redoxin family protein [Planctomycetaceae bacterium]
MRTNFLPGSLIVAALLCLVSPAVANDGKFAFELPDASGKVHKVDGGSKVTVVCFLGSECPVVQLYTARLSAMSDQYRDKGVLFIGVNGNRQDSMDDVKRFCEQLKPTFPVVRDETGAVVEAYNAERTPEVFVLNERLEVCYQGRVDDQYLPGIARPAASREDLKIAIDELLANKAVSVAKTEAAGCIIGRRRKATTTPAAESAVTWSGQVSEVLKRNCLECHRSGDIGPFSMETFAEVEGWAETMLETIDNGRMPPWHGSGGRPLANERRMSEADQQVFRSWVEQGMPIGAETAAKIEYPEAKEWHLQHDPDVVVEMRDRAFVVPAEGTVDYQYFVVDPGFTEDKWVNEAQIIPGNRSVVHHAIAFIRPPDGSEFRGVGWLTAYVPGQRIIPLPSGYARKVPAGSKIVFQMHYTPNGREQSDLTKIGLNFCDASTVTHEVLTAIGIDQEFEIPPNAAAHEVSGKVRWLPSEGVLMSAAPHMHLRGKAFQLTAETNSGEELLLNVPHYDFNWQHSYVWADQIPLDTLRSVNFKVTFDNSDANPANPDPKEWVTWGDQTWEEMAVVFLEVAEPVNAKKKSAGRASRGTASSANPTTLPEVDRETRIQSFVDKFFADLDVNKDGQVLKTEVPLAVRRNFDRFDTNGDNNASRDELRKVAERKFKGPIGP